MFLRLRPGTAHTTHRVLDETRWRRGEFFQEFLRPLSIDRGPAAPLHADGCRLSLVALHQVRGHRILDDRDAALLERVTPHIARIMHIRRAFLTLRNRQSTYAAIVDRSTTGLIEVERDGAVLFVNPAMRALAALGDGLLLDRRGLPVLADRAASRSALLQTCRTAAPEAMFASPVRRGGCLSSCRSFGFRRTRTPSHPEARSSPPSIQTVARSLDRLIAETLGLPPGAARIVKVVLAGQDLKTYADEAGLSLNAVRSHLKVAFSRTETHSQTELVRLALAVLSEVAPLRT